MGQSRCSAVLSRLIGTIRITDGDFLNVIMATRLKDHVRNDGAGLLYSLRGHLSDRYSGRYISLLLRELGRNEPSSFLAVLDALQLSKLPTSLRNDIKRGNAQFDCEWEFSTSDGRRKRADLAVLLRGEPVILFEIKEDDIGAAGNIEQLKGYIHFITKSAKSCCFVHLSRYAPPLQLKAEFKRVGQSCGTDARYRNIHKTLSVLDDPLARMVTEYLEDIGVNAYRDLNLKSDEKAVMYLLTRMFGFPHNHGFGKLYSAATVSRIPEIMGTLLGNLAVIGDWIHEVNRNVIRNSPQGTFQPRTEYDSQKVKVDEDGHISPKSVEGGTVYFYSLAKMNPKKPIPGFTANDWLYVELGYEFSLAVSDDGPAQLRLYSTLTWRGAGDEESETYARSKILKKFPSEDAARDLLRVCLNETVKNAKDRLKGPYRKVIDQFIVPG